jgi:hypothetical protein
VVRVSDYWPWGPGFDSRFYHGDFSLKGNIPMVTMVWVVGYTSVSQTYFNRGPLLLVRMFYGPPYSCTLRKQIVWCSQLQCVMQFTLILFFLSFFGLMFNLRGPQGQNPRTTCGPRTTVWETLETLAIARRGDHEFRKGHVVALENDINNIS